MGGQVLQGTQLLEAE
jgi:hypothetical protein